MEQYTAQWMGWNNTRQSGCGWNNPRQRADGTVTGLMDADGNKQAEGGWNTEFCENAEEANGKLNECGWK